MGIQRGLFVLLGWLVVTTVAYLVFTSSMAMFVFLVYPPIAATLLVVQEKVIRRRWTGH